MIEVCQAQRNIAHQPRNSAQLAVVHVSRFIGELVVVGVSARSEERNRNGMARVRVVITSAVELRGMARLVELQVEAEGPVLGLVRLLDRGSELAGEPSPA